MSEEKKSSATAVWTFVGTLVAAIVACVGSVTAAGIATFPSLLKEWNTLAHGTATPEATLTATATASHILFQDNFANFNSGWERSVTATSIVDFFNGGYRIWVKNPEWRSWSNPNKNWADVRIEVYATKKDGPDDNGYGVMCRYLDNENYYYFIISSDGYAGIGARKNDEAKLISAEKMPKVPAIITGKATNHIRADCAGTTLTLYVNGQRVASARDSAFTNGDIGLFAKTYDQGGVDILFDNLLVTTP